jgi:CBS-domain-containing membrane protein
MAGSGTLPSFPPVSHIVLSFLGSFTGILVLSLLHYRVALEDDGADWVLIVGSFGAQAVLLFAAPKSVRAREEKEREREGRGIERRTLLCCC